MCRLCFCVVNCDLLHILLNSAEKNKMMLTPAPQVSGQHHSLPPTNNSYFVWRENKYLISNLSWPNPTLFLYAPCLLRYCLLFNKLPKVLILLILVGTGKVILTEGARGDQDRDILTDEDIKEMTYDDLEDINAKTSNIQFRSCLSCLLVLSWTRPV